MTKDDALNSSPVTQPHRDLEDVLSEIDSILNESSGDVELTTVEEIVFTEDVPHVIPPSSDSSFKRVLVAEVENPDNLSLEAAEAATVTPQELFEGEVGPTDVDTVEEDPDFDSFIDSLEKEPRVFDEEETSSDADSVDAEELISVLGGESTDLFEDVEDLTSIQMKTQWRVILPRNDEGRVLKGRAAREHPGVLEFVFEEDAEGSVERSILLTPKVAEAMYEALGKITQSYQDKPRRTVKEVRSSYWTKVKAWHKRHKVLAVANFIFLGVFGITLLFSLIRGAGVLL